MTKIQQKYTKEVIPEMKKKFQFGNSLSVPKIERVIVNVGIGKFLKDNAQVEDVAESIRQITGQKPVFVQARKSIAGFKIREGQKIGLKVTLRGKRMWDFLEKLVSATLPRVRDFRGIKKTAVDDGGNLNLGIKEHLIFPEIMPDKIKNIFSFQITVVTNAQDREKGMELFRLLGFPIEK